jgi:hypothetical protein
MSQIGCEDVKYRIMESQRKSEISSNSHGITLSGSIRMTFLDQLNKYPLLN